MDLEVAMRDAESVSQGYAKRNGFARTDEWFVLKLQEEVGELTQAYLARSGLGRDRGCTAEQLDESFRAELADVFGQVLLLANHHGIDLPTEFERKWLSWKRSYDEAAPLESAD